MIVKIGKAAIDKCIKFADERIEGSKNLYTYRGESNLSKMREDLEIGVVGEMGVYKYMVDKGYECSKPDLKIYEDRRKSFDADLFSGDIKIHIKSQGIGSAKRYGNSWLFQRSDSLVKNPSEHDLICFTNVNLEAKEVTVLGFCWAKDIVNNDKFAECKVFRYRHTKVAIYFKDLEDLTFQF
jgi:hypothetical protein